MLLFCSRHLVQSTVSFRNSSFYRLLFSFQLFQCQQNCILKRSLLLKKNFLEKNKENKNLFFNETKQKSYLWEHLILLMDYFRLNILNWSHLQLKGIILYYYWFFFMRKLKFFMQSKSFVHTIIASIFHLCFFPFNVLLINKSKANKA